MKHQMRILQGLKLAAVLAWRCRWAPAPTRTRSAPMARWQVRRRRAASRISWSMSATAYSSRATRPNCRRRRSRPWKSRRAGCRVQPLCLHHRRPRRRARHPRIQHRARRAPGAVGAHLPRFARHRRQPDADDLLRQGTPGRGVQRHLLLVAEPPCGHGAERQFLKAAVLASYRRRPRGAPVLFWALRSLHLSPQTSEVRSPRRLERNSLRDTVSS